MSGSLTSSDGRREKERDCGWLEESKAIGQRARGSGRREPAFVEPLAAANGCDCLLEGTRKTESEETWTFEIVLAP